MNTFLELKKMVEAQNAPKPILTKKQRDIRDIEKSFIGLPVNLNFAMTLAELNPAQQNELIMPHQYQRANYRLIIKHEQGHCQLILENILAKKTKQLIECPEHLQQICLENMQTFIQHLCLANPKLGHAIPESMEDTDYADNGEQDYSL